VRSVVSSYLAVGLKGKTPNKLIQIDIERTPTVSKFITECMAEGINVTFYEESDLTCPMEPTELLFIDTWHVYGHLKRELERWNSSVSKYIIMHDTTVDDVHGESIRQGWDTKKQSVETGIPEDEIRKGLWPAIEEFLAAHTEWKLEMRYTNNNGLTILSRVA
jgi:cephalosporin hydroxylase